MQNDKLKNLVHLHFIVFVWGFTAILGKLITIDALPLVWYRMGIAFVLIILYVLVKKIKIKISKKTLITMVLGGIVVALHWVTFFMAIKVSNVSIALATLSIGAFFTAILEPICFKRKIVVYELLFGLLVIFGLYFIFRVDTSYLYGMILAAISAFLAATFSIINGKLVQKEKPSIIAMVELGTGVVFLSIYFLCTNTFTADFFKITVKDWFFLFILSSICTAYAFIAAVKVMRFLTPYTVMLTTNLEPVYGILMALLLLGESKEINSMFYVGALIILTTVVANGILKNRSKLKK
ncbi:putative membrane protein [Maribacter vaceletii]|uniref:Putative membrane protein n=1 Tax=Maribacter vaceletii TaxID=1206816 RepID=A0A495E6I9_9FLAO|nr:DMT family transporter [Maribacter vaceletii]RKR12133.1 putative membrane protein [Maribacter vaceletii]